MRSLYELKSRNTYIQYSRQTEMFNIILKKNHPKAYSNNLKDSHSKLEEKKTDKENRKNR